jgi:hypothetical protein
MKKRRRKMPNFKIHASYISYVEATIEAKNLDEAKQIAYDMDGGDFKDTGYGDWNIDAVAEVEPYTCPKFEPATEEL